MERAWTCVLGNQTTTLRDSERLEQKDKKQNQEIEHGHDVCEILLIQVHHCMISCSTQI